MSTDHHFYRTCPYFTAAKYMREMEKTAQKFFAPTGVFVNLKIPHLVI